MQNYYQQLISLTSNLYQYNDKNTVIQLFIQQINEIFNDYKFSWKYEKNDNHQNFLEINSKNNTFGFLYFNKNISTGSELYSVLQNIVKLVGIIIENIEQNEIINKQNNNSDIEDKYQNIISNINELVCEIDQNGIYTFVSNQYYNVLGYKSEELVGQRVLDLISPDDFEDAILMFRNVGNNLGKSINLWHIKHKNGNYLTFESKTSFYISKNNTKKAVVISYDITEKITSAEALKSSEIKFKNLVETSSDLIWETNIAGVYTYVSPQIEEIIGYSQNEVIGKSPFEFTHKKDKVWITELSDNIVENMSPFKSLLNIMVHKNGTLKYLETSGVPVFDNCGKLTHYRGVSRDITAKIEFEKEIIKSKAKYSSLIENINEGVCIVDKNFCITFSNKAAENIFGDQKDKLFGTNIKKYISYDSLEIIQKQQKLRTEGLNRVHP